MALQKGAIGVVIEITIKEDDVVVDISGATTKDIKIKRPNGSILSRAGTFITTGTDGKIKYTTVSGDLDQAGEYSIQVDLVMPGFTGRSNESSFSVLDNL